MALIGYSADQQPFNMKQMNLAFASILSCAVQLAYLILIAETLKEIMVSIFMTMVAFLVFISFVSTVLKMPKLFYFVDEVEKIVNESELFILFLLNGIKFKNFENLKKH